MLIANSFLASNYFAALDFVVLGLSIKHWINDGLMTIFFFVIGMEVKKEILLGELNSWKKASLPLAAALGGMLFPALIYLVINPYKPFSLGWGIPMATDIAFALGVLSLFEKRIPASLKVFLLALAVVDDLGAVIVIAIFYTRQTNPIGFLIAALAFLFVILGQTKQLRSNFYFLFFGLVAWFGIYYSGVHATIAGVLLGLLVPLNRFDKPCLKPLIKRLHPLIDNLIMPLFALANSGISLLDLSRVFNHQVFYGVSLGLIVGKPLGIFLLSYLAVKFGFAVLPKSVRWVHLIGIACLGGIGFTMALFISSLALTSENQIYSTVGILFGSLTSAILGALWILKASPRRI